MARVTSPLLLASLQPDTPFCPLTHIGSSLFPSNYPSISARPAWKARSYSGNTRPGTSLMATASSAVVSDDIADVLGEVGILTASGEPVKFRDLWDQQEMFSSLGTCPSTQRNKRAFQLAGVKLIAVGVGTPDKARLLAERLPFPVDILYADPDRKTKVFSRIGELKKAMI